ncbi:SH3 domain-containing protein [Streptomyces sp. NPDC006512]|uniref:SH3 domain-containing protein n=1 Tax=Streptomyces sp. NPDC006512 TaxID=3154307 RepID=UPI0033A1693E
MRTFRKIALVAPVAAVSAVLFAGSALADPSYADGLVVSPSGVKVRSSPTTGARIVGSLDPWQRIGLSCQAEAKWVEGNDIWYRLHGRSGWVSARYVHNYTNVRWCEK